MNKIYKIIDNHVHIAGPGNNYCDDLFWSKKFSKGIGYWALKVLKGWTFTNVTDQLMENVLLKQTANAEDVDYVVVLAFDDIYDLDGTYRGSKQVGKSDIVSTLYVSNDFVYNLCQKNSKILPGISVHPFRPDALIQLKTYQENAVLCKWMASAQLIDMKSNAAKQKLNNFYEKLVEFKLPLLFHTGIETSIPAPIEGYDKFNSPKYIVDALDKGVTVILAHCGCSYFDSNKEGEKMQQDTFDLFKMLEQKNWNLYADISAVFSPFRKRKIVDDIVRNIPLNRLIYGSDYPNPAKGRREFVLRPFLRYKRTNLINRYLDISMKWLNHYYTKAECFHILTNFHRLLEKLDRHHLVE